MISGYMVPRKEIMFSCIDGIASLFLYKIGIALLQ